MKSGDVVRLEQGHYAICTEVIEDGEGFFRGVLLVSRDSVESYLSIAGNYLELEINDKTYLVFPWVESPIKASRVVETLRNEREMARLILKIAFADEYGRLSVQFQDAIIKWVHTIVLGDLFNLLNKDGEWI